MSNRQDEDSGVDVLPRTKTKRKVDKPKQYKVLLHNDDYTTMEFVIWVLTSVFQRDEAEATQIMLHVHKNGMGVAGVYGREIAETRVNQVHELAKQHEYPLRASYEEA